MATSFPDGKKFYIDPAKLLPLERFLPKPKGAPAARGDDLLPLQYEDLVNSSFLTSNSRARLAVLSTGMKGKAITFGIPAGIVVYICTWYQHEVSGCSTAPSYCISFLLEST